MKDGSDLAMPAPPAPAGRAPRQPTFVPGRSRHPGRPGYLTRDVADKFFTALRAGNSIRDSARYCGMKPETVEKWLEVGRGSAKERPPTPEYVWFARMTDESRATARVFAVSNVLLSKNPQALLAWLRVHGGPEWRPSGEYAFDDRGVIVQQLPPQAGPDMVDVLASEKTVRVLIPREQANAMVDQLLAERRAKNVTPDVVDEAEYIDDTVSSIAAAGLREDG